MVGLEPMVEFSRMGEKDIHHVSNLCKLSSGTRKSRESINVASKCCSILLDAEAPATRALALWNSFLFYKHRMLRNFVAPGTRKKAFFECTAPKNLSVNSNAHILCRAAALKISGMVQWSSVVVELKANPNYKLFFIQKRVMCFWGAWNNNWRIRFFQITNSQASSFLFSAACVPSFRGFCILSRFDRFFLLLNSPLKNSIMLRSPLVPRNSLFLEPLYPFFTLIQYFKVKDWLRDLFRLCLRLLSGARVRFLLFFCMS